MRRKMLKVANKCNLFHSPTVYRDNKLTVQLTKLHCKWEMKHMDSLPC